VTDPNMTRFFMTIREAVELTMQASAYGLQQGTGQGGIFVLDMGSPVKIIDIARKMIRLAGYTPEIDIKIDIIGRRPGEKLFEELFDSTESRVDSHIPGTLGAISKALEVKQLREAFMKIGVSAAEGDEETAFQVIESLLPHYVREGSEGKEINHSARQHPREAGAPRGEMVRTAS
jgi:FlaA1/EpsC-like NDP-sugar epimerase